MKRLSEHFNSISVKKGEKFAIDLDGNASTGYMWQFNVRSGDVGVIGRETTPHSSHPMVVGGGATESTVFQALETGTIEIEANWRRPWEKGTAPAKSIKFKIDVT